MSLPWSSALTTVELGAMGEVPVGEGRHFTGPGPHRARRGIFRPSANRWQAAMPICVEVAMRNEPVASQHSRLATTFTRMKRWPLGLWLFGRVVCWRAPYFATIAPRFLVVEPGRCEVTI